MKVFKGFGYVLKVFINVIIPYLNMSKKYCEVIKDVLDKKAFKRRQIIEDLHEAKKEWNYPRIKVKESEEKLIDMEINQMTNILNVLNSSCPKDLTDFEIICEEKCKWYYEFLKKEGKI